MLQVKKWHRVYSGLLDMARSFFFLAKEFDGFPLALSPCRVQGKPKPKAASFCIVLFYVHIEILAVFVAVI